MQITRRTTLLMMSAAAALSVCGAGVSVAAEGDRFDIPKLMAPAGNLTDHPVGSADAPVTVIEYASPTCPHCAAFHVNVYPQLKSTYIDSGKVKFILRPFVRNILDAVVFMLAEAAGPQNYHNVVDTYFRTQGTWSTSDKPKDAMLAVAMQLGFSQESFEAALTNQALFDGMEAMREQALGEFKLEGTPTFYINGKQLTGDKTFEQLAAEIEPLLPEAMRGTAPAASNPAAPATTTTTGETFTPVAPDATATTTTAPPGGGATATTTTAPAAPAVAPTTAAPPQ